MKSYHVINHKKVFYTDQGQGNIIVLLHGYLESIEIWNTFTRGLSKKYRVICYDIPGHGNSETIAQKHSMKNLAETLISSLKILHVKNCFLIGHSMGGYITLMMHKLKPEMLSGFCLFHSHPFADTEEIRKKRLREIDFVKAGKKELIAKYNIPNAFANDNLIQLKKEINQTIEIALLTSKEGIIANLNAMIDRPDFSEELINSKIPFLYILGKKDNYINYQDLTEKITLPPNSELHLLESSGHMGFIEEKEQSIKIINQFLNKL